MPTLFLLFQPQHFELSLWAMVVFTHVGVVLLAFFSLYRLSWLNRPTSLSGNSTVDNEKNRARRRRYRLSLGLAIVSAILAAFTSGNGIFVFIPGILVLFFRKTYRALLPWLAAAVSTTIFYFAGYVPNPIHPAFGPGFMGHLLSFPRFFLSVLGGAADFGLLGTISAFLTGLLVLAALGYAILKKWPRQDPFLFSAVLFVLLTLAALTWSRAPLGPGQAFASRYKFMSALAIALTYLAVLRVSRRPRRTAAVALAFSIVFAAAAFARGLPNGILHKGALEENLRAWNAAKASLLYPNPDHADMIFRVAVQRKIYAPPPRLHLDRTKDPFGGLGPTPEEKAARGGAADGFAPDPDGIVATGWALDDEAPPRIFVRRSRLPGDPEPGARADGLIDLGQAQTTSWDVPGAAVVYYGFPGADRAGWKFRFDPSWIPVSADPPTFTFFARDKTGRETLIGTHQGYPAQRSILRPENKR